MSAQRRYTRTGADWTSPTTMTPMQRERAEGPFENEFRGWHGIISWAATLLLGAIFWTAFFAWWLG